MQNDALAPKETSLRDILINSIGSFIAGIVGSVILLIFVLGTFKFYNIPGVFQNEGTFQTTTNIFFPFFLSFVTFIVTEIVLYITYLFLTYTSPEKYSRSTLTYGQIALISIIIYIFITPIYIYTGLKSYGNIIYVFIGHITLLYFILSLVLEIMNNYRYILLGLYSSVFALLITSLITLGIFNLFPTGNAKLISLLIFIPLINFLVTFFKGLFEMIYYFYYKHTGADNLGDIFYQIELEEKEKMKQAEEENNL